MFYIYIYGKTSTVFARSSGTQPSHKSDCRKYYNKVASLLLCIVRQ
jgi:hypothetical protein